MLACSSETFPFCKFDEIHLVSWNYWMCPLGDRIYVTDIWSCILCWKCSCIFVNSCSIFSAVISLKILHHCHHGVDGIQTMVLLQVVSLVVYSFLYCFFPFDSKTWEVIFDINTEPLQDAYFIVLRAKW